MSAGNCTRVMRVMDVRACALVPVFEKAHARMKRIHITEMYMENCWREIETSPKDLTGLH